MPRCLRRSLVTLLCVLAGASPCLAASAGFWKLDDGTPPAVDSSGNGNTGTVVGAVYQVVSPPFPPYVPGFNTHRLRYDAELDYVEIPAGPGTALHGFPAGLTVEGYAILDPGPIPVDGSGHRRATVVWSDDDAYALWIESDALGNETLHASVNTSGPCAVNVSAPFSDTFPHVAMTYAGEQLSIYVDRTLLAQASAPGGCGSAVGPVGPLKIVRIGADGTVVGDPSHDHTLRGRIDEVRISDGALAPADFHRLDASDVLSGPTLFDATLTLRHAPMHASLSPITLTGAGVVSISGSTFNPFAPFLLAFEGAAFAPGALATSGSTALGPVSAQRAMARLGSGTLIGFHTQAGSILNVAPLPLAGGLGLCRPGQGCTTSPFSGPPTSLGPTFSSLAVPGGTLGVGGTAANTMAVPGQLRLRRFSSWDRNASAQSGGGTTPTLTATTAGFTAGPDGNPITAARAGGVVQIVTPIQTTCSGVGCGPTHSATLASLRIEFVPEPGRLLLLGAGGLGAVVLGKTRRRARSSRTSSH